MYQITNFHLSIFVGFSEYFTLFFFFSFFKRIRDFPRVYKSLKKKKNSTILSRYTFLVDYLLFVTLLLIRGRKRGLYKSLE